LDEVRSIDKREAILLKNYAAFSKNAKRDILITENDFRSKYLRDRDRIFHSKALRRLEYKTQVFCKHLGDIEVNDHLRTRLTHSIEVAQIGKRIGGFLGLNTELIEAISFGHDLGHAPFGHAGEKALDELGKLNGYYGFKHNIQSVKIARNLEKKYKYEGLNLTHDTYEGILKHTKFSKDLSLEYIDDLKINSIESTTLEGKVVAIADEIACAVHDIDDYVRLEIINIDEVLNQDLYNKLKEDYKSKGEKYIDVIEYIENKSLEIEQRISMVCRCLIDILILDLVNNFNKDKEKNKIIFTEEIDKYFNNLDRFKLSIIKSNKKIKTMDDKGENIINNLFNYYYKTENLPENTKKLLETKEKTEVIIDYISGMTDLYAIEKYKDHFYLM